MNNRTVISVFLIKIKIILIFLLANVISLLILTTISNQNYKFNVNNKGSEQLIIQIDGVLHSFSLKFRIPTPTIT